MKQSADKISATDISDLFNNPLLGKNALVCHVLRCALSDDKIFVLINLEDPVFAGPSVKPKAKLSAPGALTCSAPQNKPFDRTWSLV
jgi:hypothetical protein